MNFLIEATSKDDTLVLLLKVCLINIVREFYSRLKNSFSLARGTILDRIIRFMFPGESFSFGISVNFSSTITKSNSSSSNGFS